MSGDRLVVGLALHAVGFGVHDCAGQARHSVDESMFGVVGYGVRCYDGGGVGHADLAFGAQLVADPTQPNLTNSQYAGGGPQRCLDVIN